MYTWRTSLCFCLTTGSALFYLRLWGRASIAGPTPCSWLDSYWINTPLSFRPCRTRVYTSKMCLHKEVPLPPGSFCGLQTLPSYPIDFIRKVPRNTQIIWDTTIGFAGVLFWRLSPSILPEEPKGQSDFCSEQHTEPPPPDSTSVSGALKVLTGTSPDNASALDAEPHLLLFCALTACFLWPCSSFTFLSLFQSIFNLQKVVTFDFIVKSYFQVTYKILHKAELSTNPWELPLLTLSPEWRFLFLSL